MSTLRRVYRGDTKVPIAGELDTLVVIYSPIDTPNSDTPTSGAGFKTNLKPVANMWCKVIEGRTVQVSDKDPVGKAEEVTQLVGRMPDDPIDYGFVVFMGEQAYRVVYTSPLGVRNSHLSLFVTDYSYVPKVDAVVEDKEGEEVGTTATKPDADNLWILS